MGQRVKEKVMLSLDLLIRATVFPSIPPRHPIKGPKVEVTRPVLIKE